MGERSRQRYTPEFKRDAIALVISSGRPVKEVADELGMNDTTLGNWVRAERANTGGSKVHNETADAEMDEEVKRLRKRVRELEQEREILKRAEAFVCHERGGQL